MFRLIGGLLLLLLSSSSSTVCMISKHDDSVVQTFTQQVSPDYYVTHMGSCGACSTVQDGQVYEQVQDLTTPVRWCGILDIFTGDGLSCLQDIGFTTECALVWLENIHSTKKHCLWICLYHWFTEKDFKTNPCLQCDEKMSGPMFQQKAGRTRRNSGIVSEITRDVDEIAQIEKIKK